MRSSKWVAALALAAFWALGGAAWAAGGMDLSLDKAVTMAILKHPSALAQAEAWQASRWYKRQAFAGYLPTVDFRGAYGLEYSDNPALAGDNIDNRTVDRRELSLTVTQMLFDGFAVSNRVDSREAAKMANQYQLMDVRERLALRAVEAYLNVLNQRRQVALAQENLANKKDMMKKVKELMNQGVSRRSDVTQVDARLSQARSILVQRMGALMAAEANFAEVVGAEPGTLAMAARLSDGPADLDSAEKLAMGNHPALKQVKEQVKAAIANYKGAGASYWPTLNLEVSGSANNNIDGTLGDNNDAMAMLVLAWNLYNGGSDFSNRLRLAALKRQAEQGLAELIRVVKRDVVVAWSALATSKNDLVHLRSKVVSDRAVVDAFEEQFRLGKRTLFDLLNAEDTLYLSKSALTTGQYAEIFGGYQVAASNGLLIGNMKVKAPMPVLK